MSGYNKIYLDDCFNEVLNLRGLKEERGLYVGFPILHNYYSIVHGSCTDITGSPTSGKSQFLLEILINMAQFYGTKHLLYVPDMGTAEEVYKEIISKYTKKTFNESYYSNGKYYENKHYIKEEEVIKARSWVNEYFTIMDYTKRPTPIQFYEDFKRLRIEDKFYTASVDSWKDLKIDHTVRADLFLDDCLTYRNKMMQDLGGHMFQIVHPLKTEKGADGSYKMATAYDLKGGTSWFDNGKAILSFNRPNPMSNDVEVGVLKAKPKSVGEKHVHDLMRYDISCGRYYEGNTDYAAPEYRTDMKILSVESEIFGTDENLIDEIPF